MICHSLVLMFEISCWPPNYDGSIIKTKTRTRVYFTNVLSANCTRKYRSVLPTMHPVLSVMGKMATLKNTKKTGTTRNTQKKEQQTHIEHQMLLKPKCRKKLSPILKYYSVGWTTFTTRSILLTNNVTYMNNILTYLKNNAR